MDIFEDEDRHDDIHALGNTTDFCKDGSSMDKDFAVLTIVSLVPNTQAVLGKHLGSE